MTSPQAVPFSKPDGRADGRFRAAGVSRAQMFRARGKLAVPGQAHPLVRELFELMNREKIALRDLGVRSGISSQTISDWRYRSNPTLPTFEAVLNAAGYELQIVKREGRDR